MLIKGPSGSFFVWIAHAPNETYYRLSGGCQEGREEALKRLRKVLEKIVIDKAPVNISVTLYSFW